MQQTSSVQVYAVVTLTVLTGPDAGQSQTFTQAKIGIGRDPRSDFVLNDGFVSNRHGELLVERGRVVYRDLKSRHGTLVLNQQASQRLQDRERERQIAVGDGAELQIGSTLLQMRVKPVAEPAMEATNPGIVRPGDATSDHTRPSGEIRQRFITTALKPVEVIDQSFEHSDRRLGILFRLAGQLNGLTALDDILDLIVEATFDAFPAANFFAVTLVKDVASVGAERPFLTRIRGTLGAPEEDEEPILSLSILKRVVETRESVLFVKDSLGSQITQSIIDARITACMCAPLVGQRSLLGVMQVDTRGRGSLFSKHDLDLFNILASNVAFAIERARLAESIVEMFEGFVAASVNAIEARDPVTAGHSERVARYTLELAEVVNEIQTGPLANVHLNPNELTELRYAALLHDFGKIAVREDVLQKESRLPPAKMQMLRQRFALIKELTYGHWLRGYLHALETGQAQINGRGLSEIDARFVAFCKRLDEDLEWIEHINRAGFLKEEDFARVRELGSRHYIDPHGHRAPYLEPLEIENLCIARGTLNDDEWVNMRSHAAFSEDYLARIPWSEELRNIPCIAGAHHEKLDGSGYPGGLRGEQILPQVRMLTISDIFDALTASDRPYRKAAPIEKAVQILGWEADEHKLDRELVEVFSKLVIPRVRHYVPSAGR
jgi:HD-GYP domain-containing protein (c-di-GMP phosphodiesterase class II)/pSer/pThr/pTyr-binding forkhead associated (FHA) protein